MTKELGPIAQAMQDKTRKLYEFDVAGFLGLSGPLPKLAIWTATVAEQDRAVDQARDYVKKLSQDEEVRKDPDILENAKTAHVLAMCCRDSARPTELPAFPSGGWLLEHTTADRLATLLNLYNSVRVKESPEPLTLEDDRLEALISMCSLAHNTEIPDAALAPFPREYLTQAVILLSVKLMDFRAKLEAK